MTSPQDVSPQEMSLIDRVKAYASSAAVSQQPWLALLMADVLFALTAAAQVRERAAYEREEREYAGLMPIYGAIEDPSAAELAAGQIVTVVTVTDDGVETERVPWSEIMNPSGGDIDVRCVCGWRGKQRQLIAVSGTKYCPSCGSKFSAYPSTDPDSGPDVLGIQKGEE